MNPDDPTSDTSTDTAPADGPADAPAAGPTGSGLAAEKARRLAQLETLRAESFRVTDARVIYTHPGSGAETQLLTIAEKRRNTPTSLADALDWLDDPRRR